MKAAVLYQHDPLPQYVDQPEPTALHKDEILVTVKAVAIKHFDKSRASGKHYSGSAPSTEGRVIGGDGVVMLKNGTRVYGMGVSGMLAEKAVIHADRIVKIPATLDDATAAALPNAVIGAAMALRCKADIQRGDTVLINGATGFTGRLAVQIAKHYGAGKVIVTGRDQQSLHELVQLGADEVIPITADEPSFKTQLTAIHAQTPIDVIIDYLWGNTAAWILSCLTGNGSFTNSIRYVSVGSVTGDMVPLSAATLRSTNIQVTGSGLGAWTRQQVGQFFSSMMPAMFELAAQGKLRVETVNVKLENIASLWNLEVPGGKRLVVTI